MANKYLMIIIGVITLLTTWQQGQAKRLEVVTTLPSLASITEQIGGQRINVSSITRGVQDAHYVEAKPSYMLKLHKADLLIYSGLELEIGWLPLLIQGARNNKINIGSRGNLNASLALSMEQVLEKPMGEVDRSMGDVHPAGNPHYLLSPYNGMLVADLITERLVELDPVHEKWFRENLVKFKDTLTKKTSEMESMAKRIKGQNLVCYHVHWSYLIDWLGLKAVGYIELRPGIPPTPQHKQEIIQLMEQKQIKVVIISSWKDPTKAQEVAHSTGASLVILPGEVNALEGVNDYFSWIEYMVTHLVEAFPKSDQDLDLPVRERNQERKRGEK
jgi:zinc/manganese transport system substrate-binding protein